MTLLEKYNEYPRQSELTVAEDILFNLMDEMSDRRGVLGFDSCDEEIQEEMLESWLSIVNKKLNA